MIDARVRTAPTLEALTGAAWSNRTLESPMQIPGPNLETGYTNRNRWMEVEVRLSRQDEAVLPALEQVRIHWQRP